MRIGIAVLMNSIGGPRTYGYNLVKKLSVEDNQNRYVVFTDAAEKFDGLNVESVQVDIGSLYALWWWEHFKLPFYIKKYKIDIFHHTKNCVPFFKPCISLATIHDMAPFLMPETFPFHHKVYLQNNIKSAGKNADCIITVSQNSKKDIVNILKVKKEKVQVVYNGVSEEFCVLPDGKKTYDVRRKYKLPEKIILYVGTIQPRKNVDVLIKIFHELKKEKKIEHKLVLTGRDGWLYNPVDNLIKSLSLEKEVIRIKNLTDEDLPALYNLSDIFVYLSSYEGFGLSILEAMACGTPVIASNLSSIPEVTGDAGILVDPLNIKEVKDAVYSLASNETLRKQYIRSGLERAKKFTWNNAAINLIKIYNGLYIKSL